MAYLLALLAFLPLAQAAPNALVERYVNLRHRAEFSLQEFDRELKNEKSAGFLERSRSYRELIALRHMVEAVEIDFAQSPTASLPLITAINPEDKIAVNDLIESAKLGGVKGLPTLFEKNEEVSAYYTSHSAEITLAAEKVKKSGLLEGEIRAMIQDLGLDESSLAAGVRPSPGKDGNITGNTFPANTWAVTYDDGPHAKYTLPILANLKKYNKKATFFWLAQNLSAHVDIVEKVKAAGMALANHSYTHANLPKVSTGTLQKEIITSSEVDARIYGFKPKFFRCPYGAGLNVARIRQMIADAGMIHVFWNVDSLDWQDKNPVSIYNRVKKQMLAEKKGVVLFHDIQPPTLEASRLVFEYSKSLEGKPQAIRWVTLPEIAREL